MKDYLTKIGCFFALFAYVLGFVGGFGYAIYSKAYLIGVCVAVLGIMAFPTAKKLFFKLLN